MTDCSRGEFDAWIIERALSSEMADEQWIPFDEVPERVLEAIGREGTNGLPFKLLGKCYVAVVTVEHGDREIVKIERRFPST